MQYVVWKCATTTSWGDRECLGVTPWPMALETNKLMKRRESHNQYFSWWSPALCWSRNHMYFANRNKTVYHNSNKDSKTTTNKSYRKKTDKMTPSYFMFQINRIKRLRLAQLILTAGRPAKLYLWENVYTVYSQHVTMSKLSLAFLKKYLSILSLS